MRPELITVTAQWRTLVCEILWWPRRTCRTIRCRQGESYPCLCYTQTHNKLTHILISTTASIFLTNPGLLAEMCTGWKTPAQSEQSSRDLDPGSGHMAYRRA